MTDFSIIFLPLVSQLLVACFSQFKSHFLLEKFLFHRIIITFTLYYYFCKNSKNIVLFCLFVYLKTIFKDRHNLQKQFLKTSTNPFSYYFNNIYMIIVNQWVFSGLSAASNIFGTSLCNDIVK